jgi:hypothetical protein
MTHALLSSFVEGPSQELVLADSRTPQKVSRAGRIYPPGIGPFTEGVTGPTQRSRPRDGVN